MTRLLEDSYSLRVERKSCSRRKRGTREEKEKRKEWGRRHLTPCFRSIANSIQKKKKGRKEKGETSLQRGAAEKEKNGKKTEAYELASLACRNSCSRPQSTKAGKGKRKKG